MVSLRQTDHEMRIEIMPLIDVIFLLLTFFIYAMVLMVRAELVPMELPELASAEAATPSPAVTVSLDQTGAIFVDRVPIDVERLLPELRQAIDRDPATKVYVAAAAKGDIDRLPLFFDIFDRLANEGIEITLVAQVKEENR